VREVLWLQEEVGEERKPLTSFISRLSYKAGHYKLDWVPAKHKLAPKTVYKQDSILREYIQ
jgi:hypothetical protein